MPKVTLTDITSGYDSASAYNANNDRIEAGFDNTLSRDGTSPNQMGADLDMNSNDLLNVQNVRTSNLYVNGQLVTASAVEVAGQQVYTATATAGQTLFTGVNPYTQGISALSVYINGVYQDNSAYSETSTTSITFSSGLDAGDYVVIISHPDQTVNVANASAVPYTPAGTGAVTTNVQDKLREFVSVKDFGAIGSGDETAKLQNAINAGGDVYFDGITYTVSDDDLDGYCLENTTSGLRLIGVKGKTKIICSTGAKQIFRSDGFDDITIEGIEFVGPGSDGLNLAAGLIQINNGTNITLRDTATTDSDQDGAAISTCTNVLIDGHISNNDSKAGIYPNACTNVFLVNSIVNSGGGHVVSGNTVGVGIQASGNNGCVIKGNIVKNITGTGIYCNQTGTTKPHKTLIEDNIVIGCSNPTNINESFGLRLANGATDKATATVVQNNLVVGCGIYNYYIENHDAASVKNNVSVESEREGMVISTINDAVISNNTFVNTNTDVANQNKRDIVLINSANGVTVKRDNNFIVSSGYATNYAVNGILDSSSGVNTVEQVINGSVTWHPNSGAAISAGSSVSTSFALSGVQFGDYVQVTAPYNQNDCIVNGYVQSSGSIKITLFNSSGASRTFASGNWNVRAERNT